MRVDAIGHASEDADKALAVSSVSAVLFNSRLAADAGFWITLAASAPDPGNPSFGAFTGLLGGLVGTALGLRRGWPRENVQWAAFIMGFYFGLLGVATYLVVLTVDLY